MAAMRNGNPGPPDLNAFWDATAASRLADRTKSNRRTCGFTALYKSVLARDPEHLCQNYAKKTHLAEVP